MTYAQRYRASFYLSNFPKISTISYVNNRSFITGRSQAVDRKTTTSRFEFRQIIYKSDLPGFRRASW